MPLYKQNNKIGNLYVGGNKIGRGYRGDTLVYASGPTDFGFFQSDDSYTPLASNIIFAVRFIVADGQDPDLVPLNANSFSTQAGVAVARDPNFRDTFLVTSTSGLSGHSFTFGGNAFLNMMKGVDCILNNNAYGMTQMFTGSTRLRFAKVSNVFGTPAKSRTAMFSGCGALEVAHIDHGFWREMGSSASVDDFFSGCNSLRYLTSYQNAAYESSTVTLDSDWFLNVSGGNLVRPSVEERRYHSAVGGIDYDMGTVDIDKDLNVTPFTQDHRTIYDGYRFYFEDANHQIESMALVNFQVFDEFGVDRMNNGGTVTVNGQWSSYGAANLYDNSMTTMWHADSAFSFRYVQLIATGTAFPVINVGLNARWDYLYRTPKRVRVHGRQANGTWVEIANMKPSSREYAQSAEYRSFLLPETS